MALTAYPGIGSYNRWVTGYTFFGSLQWPTPPEASGLDPRSAMNIYSMGENLTTRTNNLATHADAFNTVEGTPDTVATIYSGAFAATVFNYSTLNLKGIVNVTGGGQFALTNTASGALNLVAAGATLWIGDPTSTLAAGHLWVQSGSDITITPGGNLYVGGSSGTPGTLEILQYGLFKTDVGSTTTINGAMSAANVTAMTLTGDLTKQVGATPGTADGGRIIPRVARPTPNINQTFDPTYTDILNVSNSGFGSTSWTWRLKKPLGNVAAEVTLMFLTATADSGHLVILDDNTGNGIITIGSANISDQPWAITLVYPGSLADTPYQQWTIKGNPTAGGYQKYIVSIP